MQKPEPRSQSDILQKTLVLKFGDNNYEIPVRRMKDAAKWRAEYFERTKEVSAAMIVDNLDDRAQLNQKVGNALMAALLKFPEKIPELVFSYAPDLPREKVEEDAYDEDFSLAFAKIWQVAFQPFLVSLGTMLEMQKAQESPSLSSANLS